MNNELKCKVSVDTKYAVEALNRLKTAIEDVERELEELPHRCVITMVNGND